MLVPKKKFSENAVDSPILSLFAALLIRCVFPVVSRVLTLQSQQEPCCYLVADLMAKEVLSFLLSVLGLDLVL